MSWWDECGNCRKQSSAVMGAGTLAGMRWSFPMVRFEGTPKRVMSHGVLKDE